MNIRRRGTRMTLWRTEWVPRGKEGNSHGYKRERYIGSISASARDIPTELRNILSPSELARVQLRVVQPAVDGYQREEQARVVRAADALWRLEDACGLVEEARACATQSSKECAAAAKLVTAVAQLPYGGSSRSQAAPSGLDALEAARDALRRAARCVREGSVGNAPESDVRATKVYRLWGEIAALIAPGESGNLLGELQARGWVKKRSGASTRNS